MDAPPLLTFTAPVAPAVAPPLYTANAELLPAPVALPVAAQPADDSGVTWRSLFGFSSRNSNWARRDERGARPWVVCGHVCVWEGAWLGAWKDSGARGLAAAVWARGGGGCAGTGRLSRGAGAWQFCCQPCPTLLPPALVRRRCWTSPRRPGANRGPGRGSSGGGIRASNSRSASCRPRCAAGACGSPDSPQCCRHLEAGGNCCGRSGNETSGGVERARQPERRRRQRGAGNRHMAVCRPAVRRRRRRVHRGGRPGVRRRPVAGLLMSPRPVRARQRAVSGAVHARRCRAPHPAAARGHVLHGATCVRRTAVAAAG